MYTNYRMLGEPATRGLFVEAVTGSWHPIHTTTNDGLGLDACIATASDKTLPAPIAI